MTEEEIQALIKDRDHWKDKAEASEADMKMLTDWNKSQLPSYQQPLPPPIKPIDFVFKPIPDDHNCPQCKSICWHVVGLIAGSYKKECHRCKKVWYSRSGGGSSE